MLETGFKMKLESIYDKLGAFTPPETEMLDLIFGQEADINFFCSSILLEELVSSVKDLITP